MPKYSGPSTRAPSFRLRCPSFLLSKFASQLKLIQSVVLVGILGICVTSSLLRVLLSGFWVSSRKSQVPGTQFHGPGCQGPMSQAPSPRVLGPGSQVLILDYAVNIVRKKIAF